MLLAMTYDLCHGGHMVAEYPLLHTPPDHPAAIDLWCMLINGLVRSGL